MLRKLKRSLLDQVTLVDVLIAKNPRPRHSSSPPSSYSNPNREETIPAMSSNLNQEEETPHVYMSQNNSLIREKVIPSTSKDQVRPSNKDLVPTVAQVNDIVLNTLEEFNNVYSSDESITILNEIEEITLDAPSPDRCTIDGGSPTPNESQGHAEIVHPEGMDVDPAPTEAGIDRNAELLKEFESNKQYENELLACNESEDLDYVSLGETTDFEFLDIQPQEDDLLSEHPATPESVVPPIETPVEVEAPFASTDIRYREKPISVEVPKIPPPAPPIWKPKQITAKTNCSVKRKDFDLRQTITGKNPSSFVNPNNMSGSQRENAKVSKKDFTPLMSLVLDEMPPVAPPPKFAPNVTCHNKPKVVTHNKTKASSTVTSGSFVNSITPIVPPPPANV